jgi:Tol biopolymer transport system component
LGHEGREELFATKITKNLRPRSSSRLSRAVAFLHSFVDGNMDIRLVDDTGKVQRFTADPADDVQPAWSPDGKRIVFASSRSGGFDLYVKNVDSALGREERLLDTKQIELVPDWAPDGLSIVYRRLVDQRNSSQYEIWTLPLTDGRKPIPLVQTTFDTRDARFSPDGKWIAYQSNESGRSQIYVRPSSGSERTYQVSVDGGTQARWRGDGREIYYVAPDDRMMAVSVELSGGKSVRVGAPATLFVSRIVDARGANPQYTVSRDGKRFLIHTAFNEPASTAAISVIVNWNPTSEHQGK